MHYSTGCPSPPPMFSAAPTILPGLARVGWAAAGSSDPLVTGIRYALYSQCGAQATFLLIADNIQGLSYNITTLPTLTQCVLRVVVYSDHCLLDVNSPLGITTDNFTTGELVIKLVIMQYTYLHLHILLQFHSCIDFFLPPPLFTTMHSVPCK